MYEKFIKIVLAIKNLFIPHWDEKVFGLFVVPP